MNKVINGKRYDTDSAREVGYYTTGSDLAGWSESLYRKRTGEYFLHGYGGPMSRYSRVTGDNEWSGDERIIPLTLEKAQEWGEKYMSADEYEEAFDPVSDDEKKTVTFSLPESVIEIIRRRAAESNIPMSEYIARLVTEN